MRDQEGCEMTIAIVLAAGRGTRMGSKIPKQFLEIDGEPIIAKTLRAFEQSDVIDEIVLVTSEEAIEYCRKEIVGRLGFHKVARIVAGGNERYDSSWNGLLACRELFEAEDTCAECGPDKVNPASYVPSKYKNCYVMIHDGARPYVTDEVLRRANKAVRMYGAVAVGMPTKDTVKIVDAEGFAGRTPKRSSVWIIQTPQAFSYELILSANEKVRAESRMTGVTDDAMIVEASGLARVKLVEGSYANIKITTAEDLYRF